MIKKTNYIILITALCLMFLFMGAGYVLFREYISFKYNQGIQQGVDSSIIHILSDLKKNGELKIFLPNNEEITLTPKDE